MKRHKPLDDAIDAFDSARPACLGSRNANHHEARKFCADTFLIVMLCLISCIRNADSFESSAYGTGTTSGDYPSSPAAGGHAGGISIINPIDVGIISAAEAEAQVLEYQTAFTQRFPFVVVPVTASIQDFWHQRPLVCLAVLAITSRDDAKRQKTLSKLLNEAVANRLVNGPFASLDLLQALIVQVAWSVNRPYFYSHC